MPSFMLTESTEVLWELLDFAREPVCQLLKVSLQKISVGGSVKVTEEQQLCFIESVAKCTNPENLYSIVKDLSRLYR